MTLRLDSHHHFWRYDAAQYPWMKPGWPIRRDFLPPDLAPLLASAGFDGSIAVQARQSLDESRFLLDLADRHPQVMGVVGWVDLQSDRVEEQLAAFAAHPRAVGVRHVVQDEGDPEFMLRPAFMRGISRLRQFGLTYDFLIFAHQLPAAVRLAERFPEQPFVLDHLAKPTVRSGGLSPWREQLHALAALPNCWCKVSGLGTEAEWQRWTGADLRPYLDVAFAAFGPQRLMYGSDWPVALLAGEYQKMVTALREYVAPADAAGFFGANAERFYRVGQHQVGQARVTSVLHPVH
jgi:L-fuconolactonase